MDAAMFDLQGHRGCRGLKPENTLPGFEVAIDQGVSSIETDVQRTRDGVLVLYHDFAISADLCRRLDPTVPDPATRPRIGDLTFAQLQGYAADRNADPGRFPGQNADVTPLAGALEAANPYGIPTLADLFRLVEAYGRSPGKTAEQRERARRLIFDIEIKCQPFRSANPDIGTAVVSAIRAAGVLRRARVRSFDHRVVGRVIELEPAIEGGVIIRATTPVDPVEMARRAGAQIYCPDFEFLDEAQVRQCHEGGIRVIPWTVNELPDMEKLLAWGVDGITTDYPDRLAGLQQRGKP